MRYQQKPNGFRIAWFIPIEMIMNGTLLHLTITGNGWKAFVVFTFGFVPLFVLLEKFLPKPVYESAILHPAPVIDNYNWEDSKSAEQYSEDLHNWLEGMNQFPWESKVHHYERKLLPKPFENMLQVAIKLYDSISKYSVTNRKNRSPVALKLPQSTT